MRPYFSHTCRRENFFGQQMDINMKRIRCWRNTNPLWWGAWKIDAALEARKLGLYLSGPEQSSLGAGAIGMDTHWCATLKLIHWTVDHFEGNIFAASVSHITPGNKTSPMWQQWVACQFYGKLLKKRVIINTTLPAVMAVHVTALPPLSPSSTPMCKTGSSQQHE